MRVKSHRVEVSGIEAARTQALSTGTPKYRKEMDVARRMRVASPLRGTATSERVASPLRGTATSEEAAALRASQTVVCLLCLQRYCLKTVTTENSFLAKDSTEGFMLKANVSLNLLPAKCRAGA